MISAYSGSLTSTTDSSCSAGTRSIPQLSQKRRLVLLGVKSLEEKLKVVAKSPVMLSCRKRNLQGQVHLLPLQCLDYQIRDMLPDYKLLELEYATTFRTLTCKCLAATVSFPLAVWAYCKRAPLPNADLLTALRLASMLGEHKAACAKTQRLAFGPGSGQPREHLRWVLLQPPRAARCATGGWNGARATSASQPR
jgi:hypothetical protein